MNNSSADFPSAENLLSSADSQPTAPDRIALFAPLFVILSGLVQYLGASFAVQLFSVTTAGAVAWGRFSIAGIIMLAWRRPPVPWKNPRAAYRFLRTPALFGLALTSMNVVFYYAISYVHLGTAVALEFLGPVILAALTGRGVRVRVAICFAALGVFLISWIGVDLSDSRARIGVALSLFAGVFWALYIWLGRKVSTSTNGPDSLAIGLCAGAIFYVPFAFAGFASIVTNMHYLAMMIAVAIFSSFLPFLLEITILKHVRADTYSLLSSLYPATSLIVGFLLLHQAPNFGGILGLICVTIAVALSSHK